MQHNASFLVLTVVLLAGASVSCSRSPAYYIAQGNKNYELGHYDDAVLNYRRAIQADTRSGEAYYRWGLLEKRRDHLSDAYRLLNQAVSLIPDRQDAAADLCDVAAVIYFGSSQRPAYLYELLSRLSERLVKADPRSFDGIRIQGYLAVADGKLKAAIQLLRHANEIRPGQAKVLEPLIRALFDDGQSAEGERLALDVLRTQPGDYVVYDILSAYYSRNGRRDDARRIWQNGVARNPGIPAYVFQLAADYLNTRDTSAANAAIDGLLQRSRNLGQTQVQIGDFYYNLHRFEEAILHYQAGADKSQGESRVSCREHVYVTLVTQGKIPEARSYLADVLREFPKDPSVRGAWAVFLLDHGSEADTRPAASELEALLKKDERNAYFCFYLGRAYQRLGQLDKARTEYELAAKLDPSENSSRFALVELNRRQNKFDSMLRYADEILAFAPGNAQARLSRSIALVASGRQEEAAQELASLAKQYPNARDVQFQLAVLRLRQNHIEDSLRILQSIYVPGQPDLEIAKTLSTIYLSQNNYTAAQKLWTQELGIHPDNEEVRSNLALVSFRSGAYGEAAVQYGRLCAVNPRSAEYRKRLGQSLALQNDDQRALPALIEAERLAPADAEIAITLAAIYERTGNLQEAIRQYRVGIKLQPDNSAAMNNLAYILADTGSNPDEALAMAKKALEKHPSDPLISDTIGLCYLKKGMLDTSLQVFDRLVRQFPRQATYRYHLAMVFVQKEDRQRAKAELQTAINDEKSLAKRGPMLQLLASL
jgi:tetratricopeptide (TPR) repeat protein